MQRYHAAVIGTGFGGSVSACRLAQAGLRIAVFERGRRYGRDGQDGHDTYPRNWRDPTDGWLWPHDQGLLDVREFTDMTMVQSAGYGGGSLIYANVHLRPPPDLFESNWPVGYSRDALDPYYDLVAYMLDINPISESQPLGLPVKTKLMKQAATRLGREAQFCYPNLAVNFGDPTQTAPNKFGVLQSGCDHCGECDIGCTRAAKNTLDLNYLAAAESTKNADVFVRSEVVKIEPADAGYRIHYRDHAADADKIVEADAVFVCAGAINSTELLLRCRDQYRTLPNLSPALGLRYSANGDYLGFAFDTGQAFFAASGPTITTGIVYDDADKNDRTWFIWEEGGFPRQIARLLQVLNPRREWLCNATELLRAELREEIKTSAKERIAGNGNGDADRDTAVFLVMGRDRANGRIDLLPITNLLCVQWDVPSNWGLYSVEERFSADIADAMGGVMGYNPLWKRLHQPVSVHNLGGCAMSEDPLQGVTNPYGEVYGYPNLFVLDGASVPAATGVNPSSTIAAVAERNIEHYIRRRLNQPDWQAPESRHVRKIVEPLDHIVIPKGGTRPPVTQGAGCRFTERMVGYLCKGVTPPDDYLAGAHAGKRANTSVEFTLTITMPDIDVFIADRAHPGVAVGTVRVDGFTGSPGAPVTAGVFNLFVPTDSMFARRMLYALPFYGTDGKPYLLDGYKDVRDHGNFDVWPATSTLYTVIREGHDRSGRIAATGIMRILPRDFAKQLTTFRTVGSGTRLTRVEAMSRFGRFFIGSLFDVFARPRFE